MRKVHCADALKWLPANAPLAGCSIITSLPDVSELPALSLDAWQTWFEDAAVAVLSASPADGVVIFYQSDIKKDGRWIDKGNLCARAAERVGGFTLLWHKIVCRVPPGTTTYGRAGYSHMYCYSRQIRVDLARALPDVLPSPGETNWTRGMGDAACRLACRFVRDNTTTRTIVDPFCGRGMLLAVANAMGLEAIGVELSAKRAKQAGALTWEGEA